MMGPHRDDGLLRHIVGLLIELMGLSIFRRLVGDDGLCRGRFPDWPLRVLRLAAAVGFCAHDRGVCGRDGVQLVPNLGTNQRPESPIQQLAMLEAICR